MVKEKIIKMIIILGPGQYNNNNLMKYPSWKIGTGSRDDNFNKVLKENYPGHYTLKDKDNKNKFTFGKEKKVN